MKFQELEKIVADAKSAGIPEDAEVLFDGAVILPRAEIDLGSKVESGSDDPQIQVTRVPALKLFHAV